MKGSENNKQLSLTLRSQHASETVRAPLVMYIDLKPFRHKVANQQQNKGVKYPTVKMLSVLETNTQLV